MTYRMIHYRGFDRDDWDAVTFEASSDKDAKERALDLCPDGHRVKSVKQVL